MLARTVRQTQRGAGGFYEHHRVCRSAAPAERIEAGASLITCVCVCRPLLTDAHYSPMVLLCSPGFVVHVEHDLLFGRHVIHFAAIFSDEVQIEGPKTSWRSSERGGAMRARDHDEERLVVAHLSTQECRGIWLLRMRGVPYRHMP